MKKRKMLLQQLKRRELDDSSGYIAVHDIGGVTDDGKVGRYPWLGVTLAMSLHI
jgi:hypothetical protein